MNFFTLVFRKEWTRLGRLGFSESNSVCIIYFSLAIVNAK